MKKEDKLDNYFRSLRERMVEQQIKSRGITDHMVLKAFTIIPRHLFVPENLQNEAYNDYPLPIGVGQTISQPYIVALMTESLSITKHHTVLEIGTGSGYQTAILAELGHKVYTVERVPELSNKAKDIITKLGYTNIHFIYADGSRGVPEYAPYDRILVTAAAPDVPITLAFQLAENGILVIPIGDRVSQTLVKVEKRNGKTICTDICGCTFVPLVGKYGWQE